MIIIETADKPAGSHEYDVEVRMINGVYHVVRTLITVFCCKKLADERKATKFCPHCGEKTIYIYDQQHERSDLPDAVENLIQTLKEELKTEES